MAVSVSDFRVRFPRTFDKVTDPTVEAALEHAREHVDADVWRTRTDTGVAYLAAHLLTVAPFGQPARLSSKEGSTVYWTEYNRLAQIVGGAYRVVVC